SLAAILQHQEATLVAWIQATGTRGHHLACASKRSSTVICPGNSPKAEHELRLKPDHPMGSGQRSSSIVGDMSDGSGSILLLWNNLLPIQRMSRYARGPSAACRIVEGAASLWQKNLRLPTTLTA